jgi:oligosaccharide repeat unit polymerase
VRNVYSKQLFIFTSAAAVVMTLVFVQTGHSELGTYSRGAFASREALGTMSSSIPGALAIYVSLILSPLSLVVLMNDGLKSWWMFVPLAVILAMAVLSVAKFAVIFCCILAFNVWQFVPKKPGGYWRRFAFPLVLVLFLSGLIVTAAYLRGALHAAGDGAVSNPVVKVVYDYATGYIPAFSGFYDEYVQRVVSTMATAGEQENRFGNQTFAGIYRLLAMLGVVEGSSFNHYDGAFNVYTILRDLIVDFGVGGSLLAVLLLGFTSQLLFRLVPVNTYRGAVLNGLIFTQMQFSLMYSLFGFIFYFVCLIISPFLVGATLPNANRISSRRPRIRSLPIEPQS